MGRCDVFRVSFVVGVVIALAILPGARAHATWWNNGSPVCRSDGFQSPEGIVADGIGGGIIVWEDRERTPGDTDIDIYAQRMDESGKMLWMSDGLAVCTVTGDQRYPRIISDQSLGAIMVWQDSRGGVADIYAQRVGASGSVLWSAGGVAVCTVDSAQVGPAIVSDGHGGAIITWADSRSGNRDIYAQRVDTTGSGRWTAGGVPICTAANDQGSVQIVPDASGGAVITWQDARTGGVPHIYAQRVNASGSVLWAANGVPIGTTGQATPPAIAAAGGGAIITWGDNRSGNWDIYAQRVDASGIVKWAMNGVAICTAVRDQQSPQVIPDGLGGAVIAWLDGRVVDACDVYAQRVDASGNAKWTPNGVPICTIGGSDHVRITSLILNGAAVVGEAIITWQDGRGGGSIYAQRVGASGNVMWLPNGLAVSLAPTGNRLAPLITTDASGGALITWQQYFGDVYAQRVYSGVCEPAAWEDNGNPICTRGGDQWYQAIAPDGSGGAVITWEDGRSGNDDLYAQRVDGFGCPLWAPDGVGICVAAGNQWSPRIVPGNGGWTIIVWQDYRTTTDWNIYAQVISKSGGLGWTDDGGNGLAVCSTWDAQQAPQVVSDGSGGAIMAWMDRRSGNNFDIYAQRVNSVGFVQWAVNGIGVCTALQDQANLQLVSDGAGGAIVVWQDNRSGDNAHPAQDIYAQRVDASGNMLWAANGVAVCTADSVQSYPVIVSDGAAGAVITWQDRRGGNWDVYAQRVNSSGARLWAANGVPICAAANDQSYVQAIPDGASGAIITWQDTRTSIYPDIYAQRVDGSGNVEWAINGAVVCTAAWYQQNPQIASDGLGGAVITWQDTRASVNPDIYAQRVDASGNMSWTPGGVVVSSAGSSQSAPQITSASDVYGGAIMAWVDQRNGNRDVYVGRITQAGQSDAGVNPVAAARLSQNVPNPFNPVTRITFSVGVPGEVKLRIYDVAGRAVRTLVDGWREPGAYSEVWDGRKDDGTAPGSGVYFYSLETDGFTAARKMILVK